MLNNKKNLLQRVRIAMVAIVTIMSVGGALAMKAPARQANQTYGAFALTSTGNHYIVTQTAAHPGYNCDASTTACTVVSASAPSMRNGQWELPKNSVTVKDIGDFSE